MKMPRFFAVAVWIVTGVIVGQTGAWGEEKTFSRGGYNYPHEVPSDYVYRTGRVFSGEEKKRSWSQSVPALFKRKEAYVARPYPAEQATELRLQMGEIVSQLLVNSKEPVEDGSSVVVTTFVSLNHLYKTSGLGRVMAEQMISELQKAGVDVVDVRMTPALQIVEGFGEYGMSRDMAELSYVQDAQAIIVGTYLISDGQVVVNARLLQQGNGLVLSSGSMVFPINGFTQGLLQDEAIPPKRGTFVELHGFSNIAPEE